MLYHWPFEIGLCSAKEGGGTAVSAVWELVYLFTPCPLEPRSTPTHTGGTPNTVILDYYDGCLTDSCACLAAARSHGKLGSRFRFDRSLLAPPATTLGLSFPNMHAHLREYACSCPRGKISGPGLFAWI